MGFWERFLTTQITLDDVGFAILAFLAIWGILTGKIYPGNQVQEIRQDRDNWKTAYFEGEKTIRAQSRQIDKLLVANETTEKVVKALPAVAKDDENDSLA